ncbi:MAG: GNAT family N-acetyltransferase [Chitinophagales bacterium]
MVVKSLEQTNIEQIIDCFLLSFENYFVRMPTDKSFYKQRWHAAQVNFELSFGMFDGDQLVGFILLIVDYRNGRKTAFNTGTGVIPEYRGQNIVATIYQKALGELKNNGITFSSLEVITKNIYAIRSYESIGYKICRYYKCFSGEIQLKKPTSVTITAVDLKDVDWSNLPQQQYYSWDNQQASIQRNEKFQFYEVSANQTVVGYFILLSNSGYLAQLEVYFEDPMNWNHMFSGISKLSKKIMINNVDDRRIEKCQALLSVGLDNTIDQYEMEMDLS